MKKMINQMMKKKNRNSVGINGEVEMKKTFPIKKYIQLFSVLVIAYVLASEATYADDPKLVSGTMALLTSAFQWILGLATAATTVMVAWFLFLKKVNQDDESQVTTYNRKIKRTLIAGVIIITLSGTISVIFSFYK